MLHKYTFLLTLIILMFLTSVDVIGQSWLKKFQKFNTTLLSKAYLKVDGDKDFKKMRNSIPPNENVVLAQLDYLEAMRLLELGFVDSVGFLIEDFTNTLKFKNGEFSSEYAKGLLQGADLYVTSGHYLSALDLLDEAIKIIEKKKEEEELQIYYHTTAARCYADMMYFSKAKEHAEKAMAIGENFVKKEDKKQQDKLTGESLWTIKNQLYANALAANMHASIEQGDYKKAQELGKEYEGIIKHKLGKKSRAYIDVNMLWAKSYFLAAKYKETEDIINSFISKFNKKSYVKESPQYFDALNQEIQIQLATGKPDKAIIELDKLQKRIDKDLQEFDYFKFQKGLIKANILLLNYRFRDAAFVLNDLYKPSKRMLLKDKISYYQLKKEFYLNRNNNISAALKLADSFSELIKRRAGQDSPLYHYFRLDKASLVNRDKGNTDTITKIINESFDQIVASQLHPLHYRYPDLLNMKAANLVANDEYRAAGMILDSARSIIFKRYGAEHFYFGVQLRKIAELNIEMANYAEAEEQIDYAVDQLWKIDRYNTETAYALQLKANLASKLGDFRTVEKLLRKLEKLLNNMEEGKLISVNAMGVDEKANLYMNQGKYLYAEALLVDIIEERKSRVGKEHGSLIRPYVLMSELMLLTGDYATASYYSKTAMELSEKLYKKTSNEYLNALNSRINMEMAYGDYERSKKMADEHLEFTSKKYGEDHLMTGLSYIDLAIAEHKTGAERDTVELLLNTSIEIVKNSLGEGHFLYAESLKNLAYFYVDIGEPLKAENLLKKANAIWVSIFGTSNLNSAEVYVLLGDLAIRQGNTQEAISNYEESIKIYNKFFVPKHPSYADAQGKLAAAYYVEGDYNKADKLLEETTEAYKGYVIKFFSAMSEREQQKFWFKIKDDFELFNNLAIAVSQEKPKVLRDMFDYDLATKALLLSGSNKLRDKIYSSKDSVTIQLFKDWTGYKELLNALAGLSPSELQEAGLDLETISDTIEKIEVQLGQRTNVFSSAITLEVSWEDIQEKLKPGEAAVNLIRSRTFDGSFTDSIKYVALIITPETKKYPIVEVFADGLDLEGKFFKYYRNAMKLKLEDKNSFQAYWEPIHKHLEGYTRVYYSPDGVYNQVNPETFRKPDNSFVLENYEIIQMGNLKSLLNPSPQRNTERNVLLVGNPKYYSDETTTSGSIVPPLPGAEEEINTISSLLETYSYNTEKYIYENADESVLERADEANVVHIATHGFFLPDAETQNEDESLFSPSSLLNNPLFRSGLIMKNGGEFVIDDSKMAPNYTSEPGILTAYEAMNLTLDAADLVVLSACETGVGDVQAGEGVYGLQRSIIVAGADYVVMSLFKVDDKATGELMKTFYQNWLKGEDYRTALRKAKLALKEKYRDPIYWGSFVMVSA